ncbi:hypothetical protein FQZ97_887340 [compost metagenome]
MALVEKLFCAYTLLLLTSNSSVYAIYLIIVVIGIMVVLVLVFHCRDTDNGSS